MGSMRAPKGMVSSQKRLLESAILCTCVQVVEKDMRSSFRSRWTWSNRSRGLLYTRRDFICQTQDILFDLSGSDLKRRGSKQMKSDEMRNSQRVNRGRPNARRPDQHELSIQEDRGGLSCFNMTTIYVTDLYTSSST